ncbi:hypothetical protein [Paenibacillus helianthi]|uniref:hypothetical protein n=1 Tax=Paenibacillus helianthi TaxID=1349432 RepID=UPI00142D47D1|nr:hypothetical protein [Paenibacillus helianthi]
MSVVNMGKTNYSLFIAQGVDRAHSCRFVCRHHFKDNTGKPREQERDDHHVPGGGDIHWGRRSQITPLHAKYGAELDGAAWIVWEFPLQQLLLWLYLKLQKRS